MKIGLVCPYNMFDRPGGVQQVVTHVYEGLKQKGHDVRIITPRPASYKGPAPEGYILLGVSTGFNAGMGTVGTFTFDIAPHDVTSMLDREKFDVLNFHEPWAPIMARQILPYSNSAHVGTFHANLADSRSAKSIVNIFQPYGKAIGSQLHLITAVSLAPATVLLRKAASEKQKNLVGNIRYIPNGVDLKKYKPIKNPKPISGPGTKTILYVGRLEKRKGVELLIDAFAEIHDLYDDVHLVIAGKGSKLKDLEKQSKSLGIERIKFLGFVSDEEKLRLMGSADVVCAPAMYGESFGIVLVEAMAMGAPVIGGANMGYKSVMTGHGKIGLVDAECTSDFANRLDIFLHDQEIRKIMRAWGISESRQYDYPVVISEYEKAYKDAIKINQQQKVEVDEPKPKNAIRRLFVR